jgi:hypothetical protein
MPLRGPGAGAPHPQTLLIRAKCPEAPLREVFIILTNILASSIKAKITSFEESLAHFVN